MIDTQLFNEYIETISKDFSTWNFSNYMYGIKLTEQEAIDLGEKICARHNWGYYNDNNGYDNIFDFACNEAANNPECISCDVECILVPHADPLYCIGTHIDSLADFNIEEFKARLVQYGLGVYSLSFFSLDIKSPLEDLNTIFDACFEDYCSRYNVTDKSLMSLFQQYMNYDAGWGICDTLREEAAPSQILQNIQEEITTNRKEFSDMLFNFHN